ncbi:MAG: peptidase [Gammaproteobacteria bacterium]|nr:peptidase [Gammaproteobacteria bacterium]
MTYCVAVTTEKGLVFVSDSRTNAGIDNVSTYSKMHRFESGSDRRFVLLSAGNLATTQGVVQQLNKDIEQYAPLNLMTLAGISDAAEYIGNINVRQEEKHTTSGVNYEASFIIGGQIAGSSSEIYLVYPQGNYITTSAYTPYLQIGEGKYGKTIMDRILTPDLSLETAALCAMISMDSTMNSNMTVGPPIEVSMYPADSFSLDRYYCFDEHSEYLRELRRSWDRNLKEAFNRMPPIAWATNWDEQQNTQ